MPRYLTQLSPLVLGWAGFICLGPFSRGQAQEAVERASLAATSVLAHAHAHNDYEHPRPLQDALEHGFTSVEADVFLVDGGLLVAHNLKDVLPDRTLESLYLRPLWERFKKNQGSIYGTGDTFWLWIDIKRDGRAVYEVLQQQLRKYSEMLSVSVNDQWLEKAVTIIISGDRPFQEISVSDPRYVAIDGRLSDLESSPNSQYSSSLMPVISDNWRLHFRYRGEGPMVAAEQQKLRAIVSQAHAQRRKIRFWATPESEQLWKELLDAQVDLIGTDDLERLAKFLVR
jgi:hypothetical protein